jgi:hypothetical protein
MEDYYKMLHSLANKKLKLWKNGKGKVYQAQLSTGGRW